MSRPAAAATGPRRASFRRVALVAALVLAAAGALFGIATWREGTTPSSVSHPEFAGIGADATAASGAVAVPSAAVSAPVRSAPDDDGVATARARIQARLDALAQAYIEGDARAIERAMWPNHAVVRPDGEILDRSMLVATWSDEWQAFANRDLRFYVDAVTVVGATTTAEWTLLLTADIDADPPGHLMINARQQGTFVEAAGEQQLDGPIAYTEFERTYNGFPWPLDHPPQ